MIFRSISFKYTYYFVTLLVLVLAFVVGGVRLSQDHKETEQERLLEGAALIEDGLAAHLASMLHHGNLTDVRLLAAQALRHPDITAIHIEDARRFVLADLQEGGDEQASIVRASIPLMQAGQPLGSLRLAFTDERVTLSTQVYVVKLVLFLLLLIGALTLPAVWFMGATTQVVQHFKHALKKIDEGDLRYRMNLRGDAEMHDIAHYFNQMVQSIESSNGKLQTFTAELADKNIQMSREVLDRHNAEKSARDSERKFHAIFDQSFQFMGLLKPDGTVQEFNASALSFLGISKGDLIGKRLWEIDAWEAEPNGPEVIKECIRQAMLGQFVHRGIRVLGKDNRELYLDFSLMPVKDEDGHVVMIIPEGRDITDRVEAERMLHETEAQVRQSQKMEAIGRLAGGIAHDFNNLLTSILGFSNMVRDDLKPGSGNHKDINEVIHAAERARELTQKLLTLGRKQPTDLEQVNLNSLLKGMRNLMKVTVHEHIEYVPQLAEQIGMIEVDRVNLEQIIVNLAVNSRDAMPKSGRLYVSTESVELSEAFCTRHENSNPGPYVRLRMKDTGCGMSKEVLEQAFEPFFTTKSSGEGTGLGLSTVYSIVQQYGGIIHVNSKPGSGTEFSIYFPQVTPPAPDVEEKSTPETESSMADLPRGTETILLVEDEEAVRRMAAKQIESLGYTVIQAGDGEVGVRVFEKYPGTIDLVVTDVVMPNLSGPEMIDRLRLINDKEVKHLYVSGFTQDKLAMHGADGSERFLIQKPYTREILALRIRDILDNEFPAPVPAKALRKKG